MSNQECEVCGCEPSDNCEEAECPCVKGPGQGVPLDFTKEVQTVHIPEYIPEYEA